MNIQITARNYHASLKLHSSLSQRIHALEMFSKKITQATVVLQASNDDELHVDLTLEIEGDKIVVEANGFFMGKAVSTAFEKMESYLLSRKRSSRKFDGIKNSSLLLH